MLALFEDAFKGYERFLSSLSMPVEPGKTFLSRGRSVGIEAATIASPSSAAAQRSRGGSAPE